MPFQRLDIDVGNATLDIRIWVLIQRFHGWKVAELCTRELSISLIELDPWFLIGGEADTSWPACSAGLGVLFLFLVAAKYLDYWPIPILSEPWLRRRGRLQIEILEEL